MPVLQIIRTAVMKTVIENEGHTEQSVALLFMLVSDGIQLGLNFFRRMNLWLSALDFFNTYFFKRRNELAVSSFIANAIKKHFHTMPTYIVDEEELTEQLVREKLSFDTGAINFVGFDCEWVNGDFAFEGRVKIDVTDVEKSPVALLQISTFSECLLIRLFRLKSNIPKALTEVLESRRILKLGVGIDEDCKRLRAFGINVCGAVDIRFLVQRCLHKQDVILHPNRINGLSLKSLAASILGIEMEKSYRVRCSNWEAKTLSKSQIAYATNDAVIGLEIFLALCAQKIYLKEGHPAELLIKSKDAITENNLLLLSFLNEKVFSFNQPALCVESCNYWDEFLNQNKLNDDIAMRGASFCQGIIDLAFKNKNKVSHQMSKKSASDPSLLKTPKSIPVRKTPLYHNCLLVGPDGIILCTCDKKKADWYVKRNIGHIIKEDPFTVQLNFDPSGRPFVDREYYTTEKENRCVVCGKKDEYVKKMIVPRDYRRHFPPSLKDHLSHDVLLLCVMCHRISEVHDLHLKRQLAQQYSAPVEKNKSVDDPKLKRVRSAANALLNSADQIPEKRKADLHRVLQDFTQQEFVDISKLQELAGIDTTRQNDEYKGAHGEQIVARLSAEGKLKEFVKMWRTHFVENMNPKFLPPLWSTEHNLTEFEEN